MQHNRFVYAVGIVVVTYALFWLFAALDAAILAIIESFAQWYQMTFMHYAHFIALLIGAIYLLITAIRHGQH